MHPMKHIKLIILSVLMAGLTACEKEILYEDIAPEPLMVVNGIQHVGEPARLSVEKSSFYITTETDFRVKDVHVDLYVNGVFKEALQVRDSVVMETYWAYDPETDESHEEERPRYAYVYCEGEYILCEGDQLRFEVSSSEFDEVAVAETTIPYAPNVISFDTIRVEASPDGDGLATAYLSLKIDDPTGSDYYNLCPQEGLSHFTTTDPVFADFMNIVHVDDLFGGSDYYGRGAYNMFNDAYFDGSQYAISMSSIIQPVESYYYQPLVMEVTKVDYSLYQFAKSYSSYDYADDLLALFTEPIQVYSNVQNGVGVVCSQSLPVTMVVDLR